MSHFSVLVVGGDVEGQLAPFDEELKLEDERIYLSADEREHVAREYGVADPGDLRALVPHVKAWAGRKAGIDEKGIYFVHSYNPNAKWDWYVPGGRWHGFFKLKPGRTGNLFTDLGGLLRGDPPPDLTGRADRARKGDIDFAAMRVDAAAAARRRWQKYRMAVRGLAMPKPFEHFAKLVESGAMTAEAARKAYSAQPRITAFGRAMGPFTAIGDFAGMRRDFIRRACRDATTTFAYVRKGEWHARGEMGWFGISMNEVPLDAWLEEFEAMLASVSDTTLLTIVDCHI